MINSPSNFSNIGKRLATSDFQISTWKLNRTSLNFFNLVQPNGKIFKLVIKDLYSFDHNLILKDQEWNYLEILVQRISDEK